MAKLKFTSVQLPLPIHGATVEIPITRGYVVVVDAQDADLASYRWTTRTSKEGGIYAIRFVTVNRKRRGLYMHRIILERILGIELVSRQECDHINRNGLDNRRQNLRLTSHAQNMKNICAPSHNTSGHIGVGYVKRDDKWLAEIEVDGKRIRLGSFNEYQSAVQARQDAEIRLWGEFSPLATSL